jgi:hypothetical protein
MLSQPVGARVKTWRADSAPEHAIPTVLRRFMREYDCMAHFAVASLRAGNDERRRKIPEFSWHYLQKH